MHDFRYRAEKDFEVLVTASEAYPALERAFLAARTEIWASFRVFDPETRLRSPEARSIGETWFDLVADTLARGVTLNIVISDFDPLVRSKLHRGTWRSLRALIAAAEIAGAQDRLRVTAGLHPAEAGLLPRLLLWPVILHRQNKTARWLNGLGKPERQAAIRDMPILAERFAVSGDGAVRPKLWPIPRLYPATHHQKLAVFDRETLYIGGLDLDERRFDTRGHDLEADQTWHDVQLIVRGGAAKEAQAHLESFLDETAAKREPGRKKRLLRTLSRARRGSFLRIGPEPAVDDLAVAHQHHARRARRLIYLETQFFRDLGLARHLARLAGQNPDLSLIVVLPGAPEDVAFGKKPGLDGRFGEFLQTRALKILARAFGRRLFIASMAQARRPSVETESGRATLHGAPIVYIHSKVSFFDDTAAIVSSANLNGRSLRWDTEAGLLVSDRAQVRHLRREVMGNWLPKDADDSFFDPGRAVSAWRALAIRNARKDPADREGFVLPYDIDAAEADATDVPVIPQEMV